MANDPVPIEVNLNAVGQGAVVVDGVDLSKHVRSIRFESGVDVPSRLVVELVAGGVELDAEAEVLITRHAPATGGAVDVTSMADTWRHRAMVDEEQPDSDC